ncbi:MAG: DNA polymerase III subunit epsilon [Rickettsiales bacterium]|jgi:DNA polymerase-3 subunit epsilon|nr:DNA polymerase III subunit epsilon [Rickettsiales bacterium]
MREIVLDIETTGLKVEDGDKIVEIGCVEVIDRKLTGVNFHHLIDPGKAVSKDTTEITGICDADLKGKPKFEDIADDLLDFISDNQVIAHNSNFDIGFINAELSGIGKPIIKNTIIDTLYLARAKFPGKKNSLDALCERYNIDSTKREKHGALIDAELLVEVYLRLTEDASLNFFGDANEIKIMDIEELKKQIQLNQRIDRKFFVDDEELRLHNEFMEKNVNKRI